MLVKDVLETCPCHCSTLSIYEQFGHRYRSADRQPGAQVRSSFLPERKTSFLPALAENANARWSLEGQALQRKAHQFRNAQATSIAEVEHRSVANSKSSCNIGRTENGLNFLPRQMPHECLIMPFTRDGVDLLRLCQGRGHAELNIPNKGLDCGESSVARGRTITSLFLNVGEEVEN